MTPSTKKRPTNCLQQTPKLMTKLFHHSQTFLCDDFKVVVVSIQLAVCGSHRQQTIFRSMWTPELIHHPIHSTSEISKSSHHILPILTTWSSLSTCLLNYSKRISQGVPVSDRIDSFIRRSLNCVLFIASYSIRVCPDPSDGVLLLRMQEYNNECWTRSS